MNELKLFMREKAALYHSNTITGWFIKLHPEIYLHILKSFFTSASKKNQFSILTLLSSMMLSLMARKFQNSPSHSWKKTTFVQEQCISKWDKNKLCKLRPLFVKTSNPSSSPIFVALKCISVRTTKMDKMHRCKPKSKNPLQTHKQLVANAGMFEA